MQYDKRVFGETPLAFEYFQYYRDMPDRTLRKLTQIEVRGKARDLRTIGRWSSAFHWQERAQAFDDENNRRAAQQVMARQQAEIKAFIEADLRIATRLQVMTEQRLEKIETMQTPDTAEMRQLALVYKESRTWLMELVGIIQEKENDATETS